MDHYNKSSHTVFENQFNLVWITKYRYPVLTGEVGLFVRDVIRRTCLKLNVQIIKGVVSKDHIHLFVSVPPCLSISDMMQQVKGLSSFRVQQKFPELKKRYWGRKFWARGYFSTTSGRVGKEVVLQYIEQHSDKPTGASR